MSAPGGPAAAGRLSAFHAAGGRAVAGICSGPVLVASARPAPRWLVEDAGDLDGREPRGPGKVEEIIWAGDSPTTAGAGHRRRMLRRLRGHLHDDGRLVIALGTGRGDDHDRLRADAAAAGLTLDALVTAWNLHPGTDDPGLVVAILRPAGRTG